MTQAVNVRPVKGEDYGSPPRKMQGMRKMGLYKKPKKKPEWKYTRHAPNYHANTDTNPGSM